jgi:SAM-dependent methyltransferase
VKICPACEARFDSVVWLCPSCAWKAPLDGGVPSLATSDDVHGFSAEFFPALHEVERTHFWFLSRNAVIAWAIRRYFPDARTFLEVGGGNGQVTRAVQRACPGMRLTVSEVFLEGLVAAKASIEGIDFVQADLRHLPWEGEFDLIGAFDVLEHVRDHDDAVAQMHRALRPGGGIVITVPQHQWLWTDVDDIAKHQRRYSRRDLLELLQRAGFRVRRVTSFVSLLLPVFIAARRWRYTTPANAAGLFEISPLANRIGHGVMSFEHALIRAGLSLPAGGSLLAVATRT